MIKIKPYNPSPYPHQSDTHRSIADLLELGYNTFIIKASRQMYGKSKFTEVEILNFIKRFKGSQSAYISPTFRLSRKLFDKLRLSLSPIIRRTNGQILEIEFKNGSTLMFFSAEQAEALRGFTVTGLLVIDEAAFINDNIYYEYVLPWTRVKSAPTIIVSTPKFRRGFFYDLYDNGLRDEAGCHTFDWVRDYNLPLSEADLKLKPTIPHKKWLSEFEGKFIDMEGSVFSKFEDLILIVEPHPDSYKFLHIGIDLAAGSKGDYTVISCFNENSEQTHLYRRNDFNSPEEQVEWILGKLTPLKPKIKRILAEFNGVGRVYVEMCRKRMKQIETWNSTNQSKCEIIEELQRAIYQGEPRIINDSNLHEELSLFEDKTTPSGKLTYGAPSGYHDDTVIATALSWKALKDSNSHPSFTFVNNSSK